MANAILGLLAQSSVHAGASTSAGVIDLPIQRESHTDWPCVFGSGVKGSLRTLSASQAWTAEVFGPERNNASDHAGALAVGDARLLLLPVRSLTSHFRWVTCPAVLRRAAEDWQRMALPGQGLGVGAIPGAGESEAVVCKSTGENEKLFLEELSFTQRGEGLDAVIEFLVHFFPEVSGKELLKEQLALVSDDNFTYLARHATAVDAHIALSGKTKTVVEGALWYEESLPPETLFYTCLMAQPSRVSDSSVTADEVLGMVTRLLTERPYLQLGGNETVGMGWCRVKINAAGGEA